MLFPTIPINALLLKTSIVMDMISTWTVMTMISDMVPLKMTLKQGVNTAHIQVVSTTNAEGEPTVAVPAMKGAKVLLKDAIFTINWKGEIVLKMDPFSRLEADEDADVESFDLVSEIYH